jgi:hypothetical protein
MSPVSRRVERFCVLNRLYIWKVQTPDPPARQGYLIPLDPTSHLAPGLVLPRELKPAAPETSQRRESICDLGVGQMGALLSDHYSHL